MTPMLVTARYRVGIKLSLAAVLVSAFCAPSEAENSTIASRRAAERKSFTDQQIMAGFFKVALDAELHIAGPSDRIRKFAVPVKIYIDNRAKSERGEQVSTVVADIAGRIQNIELAITEKRSEANMVVTLVHDRDFPRAIRALQGRKRVKQVQRSLQPKCLSEYTRDAGFRIVRSDVILVVDADEMTFLDCAYEELLQALGPINDDSSVPWTSFNDDVQMGFFSVYDQHLLNILYDLRIRPGMTRAEVRAVLPEILPSVRAWVAKTNNSPR